MTKSGVLFAGEMESTGFYYAGDEWKETYGVVIWKGRWSWWHGRYVDGGAL